MKIKKVEVCGFKSFVDRTVVHIDHDITAIVGPNGCGKSNIVDAIRWAMGEQSARHLRGRSMEDVIFNGSETLGPHSFAEVTLTFENTENVDLASFNTDRFQLGQPPSDSSKPDSSKPGSSKPGSSKPGSSSASSESDPSKSPSESPAKLDRKPLGVIDYRQYAEIAVTRRLDREGHSEYLINRAPVRLRDVTDLFLGTGVGTKAYSIIEQGRIGYIVSAKPTDRRHLIEEAAGVTRFKAKKRAAERKMDQTRQNLLRVSDIISEIERSLASLKRQAQKAERYKRYRTEIRDLELLVASHRWMELTVTRRVALTGLTRAEAEVDGSRLALRFREAELSAERLEAQRHERVVDALQRSAYELDNELKVLEGKIEQHLGRLESLRESEKMSERELDALSHQRDTLAEERETISASLVELEAIEQREAETLAREESELARRRTAADDAEATVAGATARVGDAQARIARADAVLDSFERRRSEGRERLERMRSDREQHETASVELGQTTRELNARLLGLRSGRAQTGTRREQVERELKELREAIHASDQTLERVRGAVAQKRSRLRSLEEIQQRFEGVGDGVRALMTRYASDAAKRKKLGVLGLVADRIDCPEALTVALAAALGERLQCVVMRDVATRDRALAFLEEEPRGRATLLLQRPRRIVEPAPSLPNDASVIGWMAELVTAGPDDRELVRHLLQDVMIVETLADAHRIRAKGSSARLVTLEGHVLDAAGSLTGGRGEGVGAHMIAVKREVRELHGVVSKLDDELHSAIARHGELRSGIATRRAEIDVARTEAHDAELAIVRTEKDLRHSEDELERTHDLIVQLGTEAEELATQLSAAGDEEREARGEITSARTAEQDARESLAAGSEVLEGRRHAVDEQTQVLTSVKVRAAQSQQRAESDRNALERLHRSVEELSGREDRLRGDMAQAARQQGETAAHAYLAKDELSVVTQRAIAGHEALGAGRARYEEAKRELAEREAALGDIRRRIELGDKVASQLTLQERELQKDLEHLLASVMDRHRVDLPKEIGDFHFRELPNAQTRARIEELDRLVRRMGEINLTAIEEFEEKSARYEYLTCQRDDLEVALEQLDRAIKQMNRESRRLFRETFYSVNERFKQVFPKLFGGGKAELRLTDPSDMLETGVEIIAQPPGKRLGSIELMSGGEKALTAVSLIFSIFQHRPSPFCLLDEVDAPLDEANIGRFSEAIRAMTKHSQFIIITHSKATMQMADVLYGVTMETPGISKLVAVELRRKAAAERAEPDDAIAVA